MEAPNCTVQYKAIFTWLRTGLVEALHWYQYTHIQAITPWDLDSAINSGTQHISPDIQ